LSFWNKPLALKIYVIVVLLAAITFLAFHFPPQQFFQPSLVLFIILRIVLQNVDVPLPRGNGSISVSFAIDLAVIMLFGPAVAAWLGFSEFFYMRALKNIDTAAYKLIFNIAQKVLSAGAGGYAYYFSGGRIGDFSLSFDLIGPVLSGIIVFSLINTVLAGTAMAMEKKMSFAGIWLTNLRWGVPNYLATSVLGFLIAAVYVSMGTAGVILLTIPLIVARQTFHMYVDMRKQYLSTIKALAKAIDAKDSYTLGHSERVARYAVMIGRELRLPEDYIEKLEYLALLHDIGKISVPESILNKPSKLSDEEFAVVRNHAAVGAEIISNIQIIGEDASIVRHHHEWVNGRGYPDGLTEKEIPLGAKIVAVADAFDAMTSSRIYREPLTKQEAVEELQRFAGIQFSKAVVAAFIKAIRRRGEI